MLRVKIELGRHAVQSAAIDANADPKCSRGLGWHLNQPPVAKYFIHDLTR